MSKSWTLTILSFLTWQVISLAEADYSLEMLVLGYQNPSHKSLGHNGDCCEKDPLPCDLCDNAFRFCIRETITMMTQGVCDFKFETNKIASNNDSLIFSLGDTIGGYTNPFTVSGERWPVSGLYVFIIIFLSACILGWKEEWDVSPFLWQILSTILSVLPLQGEVEILLTVFDLDSSDTIDDRSDKVDEILIHPVISAVSSNESFSATTIYNGTYSHVQLAFRLTCDPPLYGPNCTFCVDSNDTTGHYYCNPLTGDKICQDGYQNPLTNCTECKPALNCSE